MKNTNHIIIAFLSIALFIGVLKNIPKPVDSTIVGQGIDYSNSADLTILDRARIALPIRSANGHAFNAINLDDGSLIDNIHVNGEFSSKSSNIQYIEEYDSGSRGGKRLGIIVNQ